MIYVTMESTDMDYNSCIENKSNLIRDFSNILNFRSGASNTNIELVDADIIQPKYSFDDCLNKVIGYEYTIVFKLKITSNDKVTYDTCIVNIPKMYNNNFIIKSSEGIMRWRTCINIGEYDNKIHNYKSQLETPFFIIYKEPLYSKRKLELPPHIELTDKYITNDLINTRSYPLFNLLLSAGITKQEIEVYFNNIDEYLKLEEIKFKDSISSNLSIDLNNNNFKTEDNEQFKDKYFQLVGEEVPDVFGIKEIWALLKLSFSDPNFNNMTPFDIKFRNKYDLLIQELVFNKRKLINKIEIEFNRNRVVKGEYITGAIDKIFKMTKSKYSIIQSSQLSNPASLLGQSNKIYIFRGSKKVKLDYNESFAGVICPVKTPEGVSGVNVKNELAKNISIDESRIMIEVFDKNMNKVKLPYRKYFSSKILASTNYNYNTNEVFPIDGKIQYNYRGNYYEVNYNKDDNQFDYIKLDDSSILSYNASLIPMVNRCDGVRLAMGTNMIDQAINTESSEPPIVATGAEKLIYDNSSLKQTANVSGKVVKVLDGFIKIQCDDGKSALISIPNETPSANHSFIKYTSRVKEGDIVSPDTIVYSSTAFKDNQLSISTHALALFSNYDFSDEEDGFLISDEFSKKLSHEQIKLFNIDILPDLESKFDKTEFKGSKFDHLNKYGLPEIGSILKTGDIIAAYKSQVNPSKYYRTRIRKILEIPKETGKEDELISNYITVPENFSQVKIISVDIALNKKAPTYLKELKSYYDDQINRYSSKLTLELGDLAVIPRLQLTPGSMMTIRIKTSALNPADVGTKLSNRYACKGTVVKVLPKSLMPRVNGKDGTPVDIVISPRSTFNRKTLPQLIEAKLGLLSKEVFKLNSKNIQDKDFDEVRNTLNKLYITNKFSSYSDDDLIKFHNRYNGYYQIIISALDKVYTPDKIVELCNEFEIPLEQGFEIYNPEEKVIMKNKLEVGIIDLMRLHFFVEDKMAATGSYYESDELKYGLGHYRASGQSLGEMENWALLSHGTREDLVKSSLGKDLSDIAKTRFESESLMIGLMIAEDTSGIQ